MAAGRLATVTTGISLIYYGFLLLVATIAVSFVSAFGGRLPPFIIVIGASLAGVLTLVGQVLCLTTPREVRATVFIWASVLVSIGHLAASLVTELMRLPAGVGAVINMASLLAPLLFLLYVKRLATYLGRDDLGDGVNKLIALGVILLAASVGSLVVLFIAPWVFVILTVGLLIIALIGILMYMRILSDLIGTLRAHEAAAESAELLSPETGADNGVGSP